MASQDPGMLKMWLLSSRNRPKECAEAIESFIEYGKDFKCVLWIDGDDSDYPKPDWVIKHTNPRVNLTEQMNWLLKEYPNEPFYGWLADDFRAMTQDWNLHLENAADKYFIAYGNDKWSRGNLPLHITSAFAIGGDLVREVGWFAPPSLKQGGIDSFWNNAGRYNKLLRYCPEVIVKHLHWKQKSRKMDATDNTDDQRNNGSRIWREFRKSGQCQGAYRKIKEFMRGKPDMYFSNPEKWVIHDSGAFLEARGVDGNL